MNTNYKSKKRSLGIYVVDDMIYFKPNANFKGILMMMQFTACKSINEDEQILAKTLLESLKQCEFYDEKPSTDYFKEFIKITKSKSHIGLVRKAKYVLVSNIDGLITLQRVEANLKYKAFMVKSLIPVQEYLESTNDLIELGERIKSVIK